jgi:hypothetical protein
MAMRLSAKTVWMGVALGAVSLMVHAAGERPFESSLSRWSEGMNSVSYPDDSAGARQAVLETLRGLAGQGSAAIAGNAIGALARSSPFCHCGHPVHGRRGIAGAAMCPRRPPQPGQLRNRCRDRCGVAPHPGRLWAGWHPRPCRTRTGAVCSGIGRHSVCQSGRCEACRPTIPAAAGH